MSLACEAGAPVDALGREITTAWAFDAVRCGRGSERGQTEGEQLGPGASVPRWRTKKRFYGLSMSAVEDLPAVE